MNPTIRIIRVERNRYHVKALVAERTVFVEIGVPVPAISFPSDPRKELNERQAVNYAAALEIAGRIARGELEVDARKGEALPVLCCAHCGANLVIHEPEKLKPGETVTCSGCTGRNYVTATRHMIAGGEFKHVFELKKPADTKRGEE